MTWTTELQNDFYFIDDLVNLLNAQNRLKLGPQLPSGITIPTLITSPHFPRFIGQKWKQICADLGLFRIQPRASPPARGF